MDNPKSLLTTTQKYVKTVKGLCHMTIKRISAHDALISGIIPRGKGIYPYPRRK